MAETTLPPIPRGSVVDKNGLPTAAFQGFLQALRLRVGNDRAKSNSELGTTVDGIGTSLSTIQSNITALDGRVDALEAFVSLPSYTVATVPSASANARKLIYVSNEAGGAVPAFSDGTNWRRVTDRVVIS